MGFIANWKAKRSYKHAMEVYDGALTGWQEDIEIFKKITDAFELAEKVRIPPQTKQFKKMAK